MKPEQLDRLVGRIENWKFETAHEIILDHPFALSKSINETVAALSLTFGDSGWFNGNMGHIVAIVVEHVLTELHDARHK